MKNLIICCDGTWNSATNEDDGELAPTNVFKLFNCVDLNAETKQLSRYQAGVGTGGLLDKLVGGGFGFGLSEDIRDCYQWLSTKYEPGDNIYIFGFSRGAYTARSLGGMICKFGIAKHIDKNLEKHIQKIYTSGYRNGNDLDSDWFHPNSNKVKFIGVWDTVGALGIPDDKVLVNLFDNANNYRFHDTALSKNVEFARHAVAIDEQRGSFTPTLWDVPSNNKRVKQVWFPGVHSDVGGGYKESGLSDCALLWMIREVKDCGLIVKESLVKQIKENPYDLKHSSHKGLMKVLTTAPRTLPKLGTINKFSQSTRDRRKNPPINQVGYLPTQDIASGAEITLDIYAKHPWNWTGIYLEKGVKYVFTAKNEWNDSKITCGPAGMDDGSFHIGEIAHVAGSVIGALERAWKKLTNNVQADFFGTKRVEHAPWFALIGAIADGDNPQNDGTHDRLSYFEIGKGAFYTPKKSGYLYCFANDAWGFYANNRGFVTMTAQQYAVPD